MWFPLLQEYMQQCLEQIEEMIRLTSKSSVPQYCNVEEDDKNKVAYMESMRKEQKTPPPKCHEEPVSAVTPTDVHEVRF